MDRTEAIPPQPDLQQLAEPFREVIATRGLTQAEVARQIDVSASSLSSFLAGRYKGDNEEMVRKLTVWRDGVAAGDGLIAIVARIRAYTETPTSRSILSTVEFAKTVGAVVSIATTPGVGKSITLKHYADRTPAVWSCTFSKDTRSVYATLEEVATAIGMVEKPARPDQLRREIVRRIERTRGLLICDEAQNLSPDGFETIRTLHDRANVGVLFAGHTDLADRIARLPQLDGRVSAPLRIAKAKPADVDALLIAWGSECKRTRDFLRQYAGQSTGLRRIARAYELSAIYAAGDAAPIDFDHVRRAWSALAGQTSVD